jgi:hypothetical protein
MKKEIMKKQIILKFEKEEKKNLFIKILGIILLPFIKITVLLIILILKLIILILNLFLFIYKLPMYIIAFLGYIKMKSMRLTEEDLDKLY